MNRTTGHYVVEDPDKLKNAFRKWDTDKPILVHAEGDKTKVALDLAAEYRRNIHICHVSTEEQVNQITDAKLKRGESVTGEVTPQHLVYTALWSADPYKQLKPEFGKVSDLYALWNGLRNGTLDVVATDHAPHTRDDKNSPNPPSGVTGLETTVAVLLRAERIGELSMRRIKEVTHDNPRKILGLQAQPDTYIEVRRGDPYYIKGEAFHTKCGTTPFEGFMAEDRVERTVLRGRVVYEKGKILATPGSGRIYPRSS
jgi:carbamoyl-phosphate synthase/aspartate carbamoyltransferase/dihydroorotase